MDSEPAAAQEEFRLPIELKTVLKTLLLKIWWLILLFILACALGVGAALYFGSQMYESTTVLFFQPIESYVPDTFRIYQSIGEGTELSYEQGAGQRRVEITENSIWNRVNMVKTQPNLEELRKRLSLERSLQQIGSSIDVWVARDTNLMFISAQSEDQTESQLIANTIRDIFLETIDARIATEIQEQFDLIQKQASASNQELAEAKQAFADFIETNGIKDIETQTTSYATEMADLERVIREDEDQIEIYHQRIARVEAEVKSIEQAELQTEENTIEDDTVSGITADEAASRINQLSEKIESIRADIVDPIELARLKDLLTIAESQYVRGLITRSEYLSAYYDYQLRQAQITKTEDIEKVKQEMESIRALPTKGTETNINDNEYLQKIKYTLLENELELLRLELRIKANKLRYEDLTENYIDLPTLRQTYDALNGEVISLQAESRGLDKILNSYRIVSETDHSEFSIISEAPVPLYPLESNKRMIAIAVAFLVFLLGFIIMLVRIITDTSIKSGPDAKQKLNMDVAAIIPYLRSSSSPSLVPGENRESVHIELYRIFARQLRLQHPQHGTTFLTTSTSKGEGKSTLAINLAAVYGRQDEHVLIIDAQIRATETPSPFHAYCIPESLEEHPDGIGEYLSYRVSSAEEIINQTVLPGVDVILRNEKAVIPDLLQSARMAALMEELKQMYSIIIIEGAPVEECVDSEILSTYSDALLFVTACDMLRPPQIQKSLKRLKKTPTPLHGIILTKVRSVYLD
ncbi:MAG: AAA family ATPase [Sphaerochaetaceae bacterium]|nr:AAA family ATPase [Sphaerochaetaceae bacterium]